MYKRLDLIENAEFFLAVGSLPYLKGHHLLKIWWLWGEKKGKGFLNPSDKLKLLSFLQ